MAKPYTNEEIQIMIEMSNAGYTLTQIGEKLEGRSGKTIGIKLKSLGHQHPQKTTRYLYDIGEVVNGLKIIKQTKDDSPKKNKTYVVQSVEFPDAPMYTIREYHLKNGRGDAYKAEKKRRTHEGNSLYSVEHVRPYLIDIEEAKKTAQFTKKNIKVKCTGCGIEKVTTPNTLTRYGFSCSICSKGYFPEQMFIAYSEVKKLGFLHQQTLPNSNRRFDSVDYELRIICEQHGSQHYDRTSPWYKRTDKSDKEKREYCKENGWLLIELDCRKSEFEFIKNSINNCEHLPNILPEDEVEILQLIEKNKHYDTKEIVRLYESGLSTFKIGEIYNMSYGNVNKILRKNNIKLRKNGEKLNSQDKKEVVKLYVNDNLSTIDIGELYNVHYGTIVKILRDNNVVIKSNKGKKGSKSNKGNRVTKKNVKVKCINTGEVFNSLAEAGEWAGLKNSYNISMVCNGKRNYAGVLNGEKLKWERV